MLGNQYVYVDLATGTPYRNIGGEALNFGPWTGGQSVTLTLRFIERGIDGAFKLIPTQAGRVRGLRVGVGKIDLRPVSGSFFIRVNGIRTADLDWNTSAIELQEALNEVLPFDVVCDEADESLEITAVDGRDLTIEVASDKLMPRSSAMVRMRFVEGRKSYLVRLFQLPLAFTDYAENVLPEKPYVREVQKGGMTPDGLTKWSDIQSLLVPPDFEGVYQLLAPWSQKRTGLLSRLDGVANIETQLRSVLGAVNVTNPLNNEAYITFVGDNLGLDFPELQVLVPGEVEADLQFVLRLDTIEIYEALRSAESVTVPFEAEMVVDVDANDSSKGTAVMKLWQRNITIRRPLILEGLASNAPIGWQRRSLPVDFVPFSKEQMLVGQQQAFVSVIGNGTATEFFVDHNLGGLYRGKAIVSSTPGAGVSTIQVLQHGLESGDSVTILDHSQGALDGVHLITKVDANEFRIPVVASAAGVGGYMASPFTEEAEPGIDFYNKTGVVNVLVRENAPGGKLVKTGYEAFFMTPHSLKLVFQTAPTNGQFVVIVIGYGPRSAFLAHTHSIDQIAYEGERLRDILEDHANRIARLEALIPKGAALEGGGGSGVKKQQIPPVGEILPDVLLEGAADFSLASQIIGSSQKNKPAEIISGTELDSQKQKLEKQVADLKAERDAFESQLRDTATKAVEDYKKQLELQAAQQASKVITKINSSGIYARGANNSQFPVVFPQKRGAKYAALLPALHASVVSAATSVPDVASATGRVFRNTSAGSLLLPGGGGRKSQMVQPGGLFAGDGMAIYAVRGMEGTTSYYPLEMERDLVRMVVQREQFPDGSALSLSWKIELGLLTDSVISAGCLMVVDVLQFASATSPAVTGVNVGTPQASVRIAQSRFSLSRGSVDTRAFLMRLVREAGGVKTSEFTEFGVKVPGPVFGDGDLLLSIRLINWDIDDVTQLPKGQISLLMPDAQLTVEQI